ncbi:type II toxin-antitoxin system HipA family toxin [Corynebacterium hylobatis]|uniref:Type II toxin-antitoxin system HipA family toxin n=1 Tax=Corynebacterium hylobatis TaxID=1859290 RepID=A0A3S0BIF4_9CORY|nr:HipA domain-containing protein [Corynebacterium hylobatis]RSZ66141.1 type II toxin-antitoxin system HipA family toxin [Corynebacterium hylobatis]
MTSPTDPRQVHRADVLMDGKLAARLTREGSTIEFRYDEDHLSSGGSAVATTLPLSDEPVRTTGGAVPPYFAGLLPEGRRLSALKNAVKTSADDEFSLLLAVGVDPAGAVSVVPEGQRPSRPQARVTVSPTEQLDLGDVLTDSGVTDPVAIAGVQDKASARTIALPVHSQGADAILKISPPEFPALVENESACFGIGRRNRLRIPYAGTELITDIHGRTGLLVRRFDRQDDRRLAMEDAAQLLGIWPAQKYAVTMEEVSAAVTAVCASPVLALRNLAFQLAMAWLSGNGDLHAKNISVLHDGRGFSVSPVYDIPSTVPYGDSTLALAVGGSTGGLSRRRFLSFTDVTGLPRAAAEQVADEALRLTGDAAEEIITATGFDARRARDLRRVLAHRRRHWG